MHFSNKTAPVAAFVAWTKQLYPLYHTFLLSTIFLTFAHFLGTISDKR
jgi:hypothetical protein